MTAQAEAAAKSMSPIDIFFFMMPKSLWREIAKETNRYERQTRQKRLAKARASNDKLPQRIAEARYAATRRKIDLRTSYSGGAAACDGSLNRTLYVPI